MVLMMNFAGILQERIVEGLQILCAVNHYLTSLTFRDLDVALVHLWIPETQFQSGNCHGLWDGAEVENALVAETCKVEQAVISTGQCSQYHLR